MECMCANSGRMYGDNVQEMNKLQKRKETMMIGCSEMRTVDTVGSFYKSLLTCTE